MKKTIYSSLFLLFAIVVFTGCNKNDPKDVAQTWLTGFNQMNFEESMKVSTQDTKNLLSSLKALTDQVNDSAKKEMKKVKVTIKDVKINGDVATATYITSDNPHEQTLTMVKQSDKWLVQFSKSDLMGGMPDKGEAGPGDTAAPPGDTTHIDVPATQQAQ